VLLLEKGPVSGADVRMIFPSVMAAERSGWRYVGSIFWNAGRAGSFEREVLLGRSRTIFTLTNVARALGWSAATFIRSAAVGIGLQSCVGRNNRAHR